MSTQRIYLDGGKGYIEINIPDTSSGSGCGVVYQSGGTTDAAKGVYADFPSAHNAVKEQLQPATIYIDNSMGAAEIPAGTYAAKNRITLGPKGRAETPVAVKVYDGAQLASLAGIDNVELQSAATSVNPLTFDYGAAEEFTMTNGASLHMMPGAAVAGIEVPVAGGLSVVTDGSATLQTDSSNPAANVINSSGLARISATNVLNVFDSATPGVYALHGGFQLSGDSSISSIPISGGEGIINKIDAAANLIISEGSTPGRPVFLPFNNVGFYYFDTTLNLPIWWTGSAWIKADGTPA